MNISQIEELRQLDMSESPEDKERFKAICDQRDTVLTRAVIQMSRYLLEQSDYRYNGVVSPEENNEAAVLAVQDHLSQTSSVPEMEQRLLALVGRGVLFGRAVPANMLSEPHLIGFSDEQLDPTLVHRLAKAFDRCDDQEALLWRIIDDGLGSDGDGPLVRVAIRILLDEVSISNVDESMEKMVLDSIPGG